MYIAGKTSNFRQSFEADFAKFERKLDKLFPTGIRSIYVQMWYSHFQLSQVNASDSIKSNVFTNESGLIF